MKNVIALIALTLVSCGELKEAMEPKATPAPTPVAETVTFQGSAQYAFEITVDGQKFNDIEHYYTEQALTLKDKVIAAGYNADKVEFVGELGFDDFIKDMTVFVSSSTGTQGKTEIDAQGNFSVEVANPNQDKHVTFKVRATKRIQVILSSGDTVTNRLCYNFSAVEQDVIENPISLSAFETSRTLYNCEQVSKGMVIPEAAAKAVPVRTLSLNSDIKTVWVKANSNEFYVDTNSSRQLFTLPRNGSTPVALSAPETYSADPEGFSQMATNYRVENPTGMLAYRNVPVNSDMLMMKASTDWTEVSVVRNSVVTKSFVVSPYGLYWFAVSGDKVMSIGRVDGNNEFKVGVLDLHTNQFIPMADAPNCFAFNTNVGLVDGVFAVITNNTLSFYNL